MDRRVKNNLKGVPKDFPKPSINKLPKDYPKAPQGKNPQGEPVTDMTGFLDQGFYTSADVEKVKGSKNSFLGQPKETIDIAPYIQTLKHD